MTSGAVAEVRFKRMRRHAAENIKQRSWSLPSLRRRLLSARFPELSYAKPQPTPKLNLDYAERREDVNSKMQGPYITIALPAGVQVMSAKLSI